VTDACYSEKYLASTTSMPHKAQKPPLLMVARGENVEPEQI
jgi:hypothetical protein